jgi:peptidoglycan/LPS O-acetylase OafA/YrhL
MATVTDEPAGGPEATAVDEAGTAPGDRRFRPDIEGLRAVAVLLVVLYHADLPGLTGGFVGVDVFFVISGFVITGLLLRERATTGRTSLPSFYGRRVRRILPAATLVICTTVIATYAALGVVDGNPTAVAARWTAVFLANFHFASNGTDYLAATLPPSPLQNFWSLAVEEQFYLVFPAIFLLAASLRSTVSLRARLAVTLVAIVAFSLLVSAVQTSSSPAVAFFSPLTRAWELALGALVAVATPSLLRLPRAIAAVLTWAGAAAIGFAAVAYSSATPYPGTAVVVPVVGTALVIAGGTPVPRWGVEPVLALAPVQWLGRLSYSLYLWHWPILIIAAEAAGLNGLPFHRALGWLALSLVVAYATHHLIENPVRHARTLVRSWRLTLSLGAILVAVSLAVASVELAAHPTPAPKGTGDAPAAVHSLPPDRLAALVAAAPRITTLPTSLTPSLAGVRSDWGGPPAPCWPSYPQSSVPACVYGDPQGTHTMVLYGDSHAAMWFDMVDFIAALSHWRLVVLAKGACPVVDLPFRNPPSDPGPGGVFTACSRWHAFALQRIREIDPDLVVITQFPEATPQGASYSAARWGEATASAIRQLPVPVSRVTVLGNIPVDPHGGPECLSLHPNDVQACTGLYPAYWAVRNAAERQAARTTGARYIDTVPWFCSTVCTDVVGRYQPYWDGFHVTATYAIVLGEVLAEALDLRSHAPVTAPPAPPAPTAAGRPGPAG